MLFEDPFPTHSSYKSSSPLSLARIIGVQRLKAQPLNAKNPITGEPLDPVATLATLKVDVQLFDGRPFDGVPVLTPSASVDASGLFSVPRPGDYAVVGFIEKGQPYVLGYFVPPDSSGRQTGDNPVALQSGEIAILAPSSPTPSGIILFQGGVVRAQASPNTTLDLIPAGETISAVCRTFSLTQDAGFMSFQEIANRQRHTVRHERFQSQARRVEEDAPFWERYIGHIGTDEVFSPILGTFPSNNNPVIQTTVNGNATWGVDETGSISIETSDSDAKHRSKLDGTLDSEVTGDTTLDLGSDFSVSVDGETSADVNKMTINSGGQSIEVELDPDSGTLTVSVGATDITISGNEIDIDNSSAQVSVNASTILLAGGAEGVALANTLFQYLSTMHSHATTHTHTTTAPGSPTSSPRQPLGAPPSNLISQKVKAS